MNFDLSEEQKAYRDAARQFARAEFQPHAEKWDQRKIFPKEVIAKAAEMGFCGVYIREDVGGLMLPRLEAAIIFEELAYGCTSTTAYITIHNMVTWMIDQFGSQELRQKWCPKMVTAELLGSYCLTEANSGSDAASLSTKALKEGDHYVLNGAKSFVSGGGATDVLVVMCRTGDDTPKGISTLLVPSNTPGVSYGEQEKKMGWNSQPTCIVNFDNVRVPTSHLLGAEGQGFKIAMMGLDGGRLNIGTCSLGTAQSALDAAQAHLLERKQFGKPLATFQALQFKIADMQTELIAARTFLRLAAWKYDHQDPQATAYCAMAKRYATDVGFQVCNEALQIFGGYGYTKEYKVERHLRDLRVHQILEGTNEIMRVIASRKILEEGATEQFR